MNIRLILGALLGAALLGAALLGASAQAAVKYTVTDLGTLGGTWSDAYDVNNAGQVVGDSKNADGYNRAFLWQNNVMMELGALGGENSRASSINDSGQVVGHADAHAFLWQNGTMTALSELPGVDCSAALGINRYGQVVGYARVTTGRFIPVTWKNGTMIDLSGDFPGGCGFYPAATDINDVGQVVGYTSENDRGFLWRDGALTDLGSALGGATINGPPSINNVGQVVGYSGAYQSFLWENSTTTPLALLPGGQGTVAHDINNLGQIVGADVSHRAVLWEDGVISDLNDLIPAGSGWMLTSARGINDFGQIVGYGMINGNEHAFLLTVPEPATLSLVALGGLVALRRRR